MFIKRVQNNACNKHKGELSDGDLLVHVDFAEGYRNDQKNEIQSAFFGIKAFHSLHRILKVQQAR